MSDETTMDWIEVTVSGVDGEAAEALSEVIGRYAQGGAVIEQIVSEGFAPSASPPPASPASTWKAANAGRSASRTEGWASRPARACRRGWRAAAFCATSGGSGA